MISADEERWLPISGWDDYEVSDLGTVRRSRDSGHPSYKAGHVKAVSRRTYVNVGLKHSETGQWKYFGVHQLVALAFIGPPPSPKHQVAHNDGDRWNNNAKNLRWATAEENNRDRIRHGTSLPGEQNPRAKLTNQQAAAARRASHAGVSAVDIGILLSVSPYTVWRVLRNEGYKE